MKTVQELREMLKARLDEATKELREKAAAKVPKQWDPDTLAIQQSVLRNLECVIRNLLKPDTRCCTPTDDFYPDLAHVLNHRIYVSYEFYEIAPDVTDEQILAHRAAIVSGKLSALKPLLKSPAEDRWVVSDSPAYQDCRRLYGNLAYYLCVMAHLARRYDARGAGFNFLRAYSIARKGMRLFPLNLTESAVNELIAYAQDGAEELMIAADYCNMSDWDVYRAAEAEKLAAADAEFRRKAGK